MDISYLEEHYPDRFKMTGYDDCIIGIMQRYGMDDILCYDKVKVLKKLMLDMSYEDAIEWFEFNMIGAYVGELTPCFLETGEMI